MSSDGDGRPALLIRNIPNQITLSPALKRDLRTFLKTLTAQVTESRPFTCLLTNDEELQRLNHSFLGHNYPTDVLSFPLGSDNGPVGDLAISLERAEGQARHFEHQLFDEIRVLMLHGALHLMGFDHERDRGEMSQAEGKWQRLLGLPSPLTTRQALPDAATR